METPLILYVQLLWLLVCVMTTLLSRTHVDDL